MAFQFPKTPVVGESFDKWYWNGSEWLLSESGGGGAQVLNDLADVDTVDEPPTDGQVLTWVDSESLWKPRTSGGPGTIPNLSDLPDVDADNPDAGQALVYNGSKWAAGAPMNAGNF